MDEWSGTNIGIAVLIVALVVVAYVIRELRLRRTKRRIGECLTEYFDGGLSLDQLRRQARDISSDRFIGSSKCQALVQAAFQRSVEAKLVGKAHSLEIEKRLLTALADVKWEFGLPDRYQNKGWNPGRE